MRPRCLRLVPATLCLASSLGPAVADDGRCDAILSGLRRLVLVTTPGMDGPAARLRFYERDTPGAPWRPVSGGEAAVVGTGGLAWGFPYRSAARAGEPVKVEGDRRTPAGVFRIGRSFGSTASRRPHHLVLAPGRVTCVDDPGSRAYNTLVPHRAGETAPHGEDMGAEPLYRRGLVINYPSDARARAGSCIFLHVWRGPGRGTAGCVALPEARVAALQDFSASGAIAILPQAAMARFSACLPGVAPKP